MSLLERYEVFVNDLYIDPLQEEVLGCFTDIHNNVQKIPINATNNQKPVQKI